MQLRPPMTSIAPKQRRKKETSVMQEEGEEKEEASMLKISFELLVKRWQRRMGIQQPLPSISTPTPQLAGGREASSREDLSELRKKTIAKVYSFLEKRVEDWNQFGEELRGIASGLEGRAFDQSENPQQYARKIAALLFNVAAIVKEENENLSFAKSFAETVERIDQVIKKIERRLGGWKAKPYVLWPKEEKDVMKAYQEIFPLHKRAEILCHRIQQRKSIEPEELPLAKDLQAQISNWETSYPTIGEGVEEPPGQSNDINTNNDNKSFESVNPKIAISQPHPNSRHLSIPTRFTQHSQPQQRFILPAAVKIPPIAVPSLPPDSPPSADALPSITSLLTQICPNHPSEEPVYTQPIAWEPSCASTPLLNIHNIHNTHDSHNHNNHNTWVVAEGVSQAKRELEDRYECWSGEEDEAATLLAALERRDSDSNSRAPSKKRRSSCPRKDKARTKQDDEASHSKSKSGSTGVVEKQQQQCGRSAARKRRKVVL